MCFETIDSTNEGIKREARKGAEEGLLFVAAEQTAGKGRSGRSWVSPRGEAVYFSFLLKPKLPPENVSALTLVMGLSVAEAVSGILPAGIKWPNDIVVRGRKICGILTEAEAESGQIGWIVVGTGINVNNTAFDGTIRDRATSLRIELGRNVPIPEITVAALRAFHRNYKAYMRRGDMTELIPRYNEYLVNRGKQVRIEDPAGAYTARARGIDELGRLIVERDGKEERIASGEVSVRGLWGYV